MHLTLDHRLEAYQIGRMAWIESGYRKRHAIKLAKKELVMRGWEELLIELVIRYLIPLILEWWKNRRADKEFAPAVMMPLGFGEGQPVEPDEPFYGGVGDDDEEA